MKRRTGSFAALSAKFSRADSYPSRFVENDNFGVKIMAENKYKNKTVSVLGDSISTFLGYIPERNAPRYPQENLLMDVEDTWWMRVIAALDMRLAFNDSWAGSQVSNIFDSPEGNLGPDRCMANPERIKNLSRNSVPDVIFLYGGTNDVGRALYPIGVFDATACPLSPDWSKHKWQSFTEGYTEALLRLRCVYPDSQIICLLPGYVRSYYTPERMNTAGTELEKICNHLGVKYIDLKLCGIGEGNYDKYLPDGIHPNREGMKLIADYIISNLI